MRLHMLRHTFVTTMLDAGVDLRDVEIAARHADPKTTMRYDRARNNLDRQPATSSPPAWPLAPRQQPMRVTSPRRPSAATALTSVIRRFDASHGPQRPWRVSAAGHRVLK